jgi:hypothetical protein
LCIDQPLTVSLSINITYCFITIILKSVPPVSKLPSVNFPKQTAGFQLHSTHFFLYPTLSKIHTTDFFLYSTISKVHTTDFFLYSIISKVHTTDFFLHPTISKVHTTDFFLYTTISKLCTIDLFLTFIRFQHNFSISALIGIIQNFLTQVPFRSCLILFIFPRFLFLHNCFL